MGTYLPPNLPQEFRKLRPIQRVRPRIHRCRVRPCQFEGTPHSEELLSQIVNTPGGSSQLAVHQI